MKKSNSLTIVFIALMGLALIGSVILVKQNSDTRKGAYFSSARLSLQPSDRIVKKVGENVPVALFVNSPVKTSGIQFHVCYGKNIGVDADTITRSPGDFVRVASDSNMSDSPIIFTREGSDSQDCLNVTIPPAGKDESLLKDGTFQVATLNFKALTVGEGDITIDASKSELTGPNPEGADKAISVSGVDNTSYRITADDGTVPTNTPGGDVNEPTNTPPITGEGRLLKFRMTYGGVKTTGKCATGWTVKVVAMGGGVNKSYTTVPVRVGEDGEKPVYEASLRLSGFTATENVAIFVKGPKHLQIKYGKDGQTEMYNQAGGEISLADENRVHDFARYSLLAGDVVGPNGSGQDGVINAIDFVYVKTKALSHANLADGTYELADLDGNCSLNTRDVDIVRQSLNEKQGQLY